MNRSAVFGFAALGALAVAAFWPSYLTRIAGVGAPVHAHALAMSAPTFFLFRLPAWRALAEAIAAT